jgi:site-specific DNA recombinase
MSTTEARRVHRPAVPVSVPRPMRVALYTRKSSEKGLDQAFNSIDAQRQMLEEFVARHADQGWVALPERYDDGGFTGGNTNRPAFQRLLADIEAGRIDKVAVYRLDRLSRSTGDFVGILQTFSKYGIEAVSPNERIEHATAGDRLTLGMRMQVSQYEREIAAERIRDKMRAARRQGHWQGGRPVLGYDVVAKKLIVNEAEAGHVRAIFESFLRTGSIVATLADLDRRGIRNKSWTTQRGRVVTGSAFDSNSLRKLLGQVVYIGKLHAGKEIVGGDQPAIVPQETWDAAQALLGGDETGRSWERKPSGALLQGLLRCAACGGGMVAHYTLKGTRRYGAYVCGTQRRRGRAACPGSRAPLGDMETFVVEKIRAIGRDPALVAETVAAAGPERTTRLGELRLDLRRAEAENSERVPELRAELAALKGCVIDADLAAALASFDAVWDALFPAERARILHLLIERIVFDASTGTVSITYRAGGVAELAHGEEGAAA